MKPNEEGNLTAWFFWAVGTVFFFFGAVCAGCAVALWELIT